jgi:hypothetical protein
MNQEVRLSDGTGGEKCPQIAGFRIAAASARRCFGLGYEVFGRGYGALFHPAALLYGCMQP